MPRAAARCPLYEIDDGRYEELPEMSTQAAVIAFRLARRLGNFAEEKQLGRGGD